LKIGEAQFWGLTDPAEIHAVAQEVRRLLERFRDHLQFAELDAAERHHEVPYFLPEGRGAVDLLYRTESGWFIVDFKTRQQPLASASSRTRRLH
jgi:ATP-dependent exoDNAse (exonuclease V) beta subunit